MQKTSSFLKTNVSYHPAYFFPLLLVANTLLSYFDLSLAAKLEVFLFGLVLPFFLALASNVKNRAPVGEWNYRDESSWPSFSPWLFGTVLLFGCLLRLYRLTSLSTWPYGDEGTYAYGAMELSEKGTWHFLYTVGQHPPFFSWTLAFFFKLFQPSLVSLWLAPAFCSVLVLLFTYGVCRAYFSKPFTLICLILMAAGFWPLYDGRIANNETFALFWESLTLWMLVLWVKKQNSPRAWWYTLVLGIFVGLGFYSFVVWVEMALAFTLAVVLLKETRTEKILWAYFTPLLVLILIFLPLYYDGSHLAAIRSAYRETGWIQPTLNMVENFRAVFWGSPLYRLVSYAPDWGGLLNPILDSFFLLGVLWCLRNRKSPFVKWIGLCLALTLVPGLATRGVETFRIIYALPFLYLVSAFGISELNSALKTPNRKIVWLVLVLSVLLDVYHLNWVYHATWGVPGPQWSNLKSVPECEACQILQTQYGQEGPGMVLSDLRPIQFDQTLMVGAYGFDAAHNPKVPFEKVKWAAVIVSDDYKPFLNKRFPGMAWYGLGKEFAWDPMDWALGVIPVTDGNKEIMGRWLKGHEVFKTFTREWMDRTMGSPEKPLYDQFLRSHEGVTGDPFLESCFWEKMMFFHWAVQRDRQKTLEDIGQYLKYGYPSPRILKLRKGILEGA